MPFVRFVCQFNTYDNEHTNTIDLVYYFDRSDLYIGSTFFN